MTPAKKATKGRKQRPRVRRGRGSKHLVETLLIIGAILLIPLFFAVRSGAIPLGVRNAAAPRETALAKVPPLSPSSPASNPEKPPRCAFPLAKTTEAELAPETYVFSEPQIKLTASGNLYRIIEWLPDNQQVLMTEDLVTTRELQSDKMLRQSIQLYDPDTGTSQVYATAVSHWRAPSVARGIQGRRLSGHEAFRPSEGPKPS